MRGFRRILRTAGAVAAVFVGSASANEAAGEVKSCNAATGETIELPKTKNEVQFKCGTDYTQFFPEDLSQVYLGGTLEPENVSKAGLTQSASDSTPQPSLVALAKLVLNATLTKNGDTYTFAVSHSTVVDKDQTLYYYCKKSGTEYCRVTINVKTREMTPAITCDSQKKDAIFLSKGEQIIKFACGTDYSTLLPGLTETYITETGETAPLAQLYRTAMLTRDDTGSVYTLSIPERPSSKLLHYSCQKTDGGLCNIQVTVEKNIKTPSDEELEEVTCTATKQNLALTLSAESPGIAFACGLDVPTLDPAEDKVYEGDETEPKQLSTIYKKAGIYTNSSVAAYVYFLYVPYREDKKVLSYKCKKDSTTCTVKITVEPNKGVIPVCRNAAEGAHLSYEDFDESVKFKCDAKYPKIVPSDLAKVYREDPNGNSAAEAVPLTKVYGGAKLVSDGDTTSPTFTLTIPPHLPREVENIYYQCKEADDTHCTVRIRVAKKEQQMRTCEAGKEEKVTITGPGEIVRFKCGAGMSLHPTSLKEVYDNTDSKCSTPANLTELVPDAHLTTDSTDKTGSVITFTELPKKEQALCYSCSNEVTAQPPVVSFRAPQTAQQCKVVIDVKSAALGLSAQTLAGHALFLASLAGTVLSAL